MQTIATKFQTFSGNLKWQNTAIELQNMQTQPSGCFFIIEIPARIFCSKLSLSVN